MATEISTEQLQRAQSSGEGPGRALARKRAPDPDAKIVGLAMMTDRVEINPAVLQGKPVVRGTRIPVEGILRKLSEGATEAELLDAYPRLTHDDIQAALRYAADVIAHEVVVLPRVV